MVREGGRGKWEREGGRGRVRGCMNDRERRLKVDKKAEKKEGHPAVPPAVYLPLAQPCSAIPYSLIIV